MKRLRILLSVAVVLGGVVLTSQVVRFFRGTPVPNPTDSMNLEQQLDQPQTVITPHELTIDFLKSQQTPGSEITFHSKLPEGRNYSRHVVSYQSQGFRIYGLMTIPNGTKPEGGWPVIVFNHGYIAPTAYRTTEKYVAYQDAFARAGYITLKSDYRGHGSSEGPATGAYGSPGYTIDVLNAVASLKNYSDANAEKIGMWGHSMGGYITLRSMVVRGDIKAGVIWAGVVASYPDMLTNWRRQSAPPQPTPTGIRRWREALTAEYGTPQENATFWNSISANSYLQDISGPIQIHHGTADTTVPVEFSTTLDTQLKAAGKESQLYLYSGDDHNLSKNLSLALQRSVSFFDQYLK